MASNLKLSSHKQISWPAVTITHGSDRPTVKHCKNESC